MPTLNLPGYYWDEAKNRFFPISSKPKQEGPVSTITTAVKEPQVLSVKRNHPVNSWTSTQSVISNSCYVQRRRILHEILCSHYGSTTRLTLARAPTIGSIQVFRSTDFGGRAWRFIGDDHGWLYSHRQPEYEDQGDIIWAADLNLQPSSEISSISISGSTCVATCFGHGKISVLNLNIPQRMYIMNLGGVRDIFTSCLLGPSLILGALKKAAVIHDIDNARSPQYLHTNSDVFSVVRREHLVYTGVRNGSIERFDLRIARNHSEKLFGARFGVRPRSSVLHLDIIGDSELLVSHMDGGLATYDLRFPSTSSSTSLTTFHGHVNSHSIHLGIDIDRSHGLLFAAGQDCLIRGWSLRTGAPISPPEYLSSDAGFHITNPLSTSFSRPPSSLQVTEELGSAGTCLWAAVGHDLYQYHLGQRVTPS